MNCTEARSVMLACELAELAPGGASPLAGHLDQCADCRARAAAIVARTAALRAAVAARRPLRAQRASRRGRAIGAVALAAGLLLVIALAPRARRTDTVPAPVPHPAQGRGAITIDNAQGRAVTIVEGPNAVEVVFHTPEPNE